MPTTNPIHQIASTDHFADRARERGLSPEVTDFILTWGEAIEARDNAYYFTVVRRDLSDAARWSSLARRADGWVLVVSDHGTIITCFRQPNAWRWVRRNHQNRHRAA